MKYDAEVHIKIRMVIDADTTNRRAVRPLARAFAERVVNANQILSGDDYGDPKVTEWSLDIVEHGLADAWPFAPGEEA